MILSLDTERSLQSAEAREASGNAISTACAEAWEEAARLNTLTPLTRAWLAFSEAVDRALAHSRSYGNASDYGRRCMSAGRWL